jgi:hypothetical protein
MLIDVRYPVMIVALIEEIIFNVRHIIVIGASITKRLL